jgi:site-specific DNA recombinase
MTEKIKIKKRFPGSQLCEKIGGDIQPSTKAGEIDNASQKQDSWSGNDPTRTVELRPGRIAAYARVSTQAQKSNETINSQIAAIREFLAKRNCQISDEHIYADDGYSGSILSRPSLDKLRDNVAMLRYDCVVIYDPDRLARKYVYQMLMVEEFERHGCRFEFIRRPIGQNPDEALLLQMQGVIAEYERAKISERTRRGKLHKMKAGELVSAKRAFGYKYIPKQYDSPARYTIVEEEAGAVRKIFSWFLDERARLRHIAKKLNEEKVPTAKGGDWHASSVRCVLTNFMCTGTGYAHKYKAVIPARKNAPSLYSKYEKSSNRLRGREEWLPFSCPRIIDDETFELAQARLENNKKISSRNTVREYLLRGLIFCPVCKRRMQIDVLKSNYFCAFTRKSKAESSGLTQCANAVKFPVGQLDDLIWREAAKIVKRPASLKTFYKRHAGKITPQVTQGGDKLNDKIRQIKEQMKRLNSLFIEGALTKEEHSARYRILSDKNHVLQSQLDKNSDDHFNEAEAIAMLNSFSKFSDTARSQLKNANFETKRFIVEQLVNRVELSKNDITIELSAPLNKSGLCTNNLRQQM